MLKRFIFLVVLALVIFERYQVTMALSVFSKVDAYRIAAHCTSGISGLAFLLCEISSALVSIAVIASPRLERSRLLCMIWGATSVAFYVIWKWVLADFASQICNLDKYPDNPGWTQIFGFPHFRYEFGVVPNLGLAGLVLGGLSLAVSFSSNVAGESGRSRP